MIIVSHSYIFTQNFQVEVLGVDLSKNMIDIGKQRAKEFKDDKVMCCTNLILHLGVIESLN